MATYRINEAEFDIPATWSDRSVNIFTFTPGPQPSMSLVVTRDETKPGQGLANFADEKLEELAPKLQQFKLIEKRQIDVSGTIALDAEFSWRSDKGPVHQKQAYVSSGRQVLIFTITSPGPIRDDHRAQFDAVLSSVKFVG